MTEAQKLPKRFGILPNQAILEPEELFSEQRERTRRAEFKRVVPERNRAGFPEGV